MSQESIAKFVETVNASPQLLEECRSTFASPDPAAFVAFAQRNGVEVTAEEVVSFFRAVPGKGQELGEAELAQVAGGVIRGGGGGDPVQFSGLMLVQNLGISPLFLQSNPISYTPITIP